MKIYQVRVQVVEVEDGQEISVPLSIASNWCSLELPKVINFAQKVVKFVNKEGNLS